MVILVKPDYEKEKKEKKFLVKQLGDEKISCTPQNVTLNNNNNMAGQPQTLTTMCRVRKTSTI